MKGLRQKLSTILACTTFFGTNISAVKSRDMRGKRPRNYFNTKCEDNTRLESMDVCTDGESVDSGNNSSNSSGNVADTKQKSTSSKMSDFLTTLFLGEFGVHKFVEGKTGMGVLYLLTGGLFLIGWLVDIVKAAKSLTD